MLQVLLFNVVQMSILMYERDMFEFITEQSPIIQVDMLDMQSPTLHGLMEKESVLPMISQLVLLSMFNPG